MWFLSLTYYCTPGFYYIPIPVKGVHLALLRYNAIKSPLPVYSFWRQYRIQWHCLNGKLKARPYIYFSSVNLLEQHWFRWRYVWLHLEMCILGSASPSPQIAGNREGDLRKYSCAFALFYALLQISTTEHCPRQGTRPDGASACPHKVLCMSFCKAKIPGSTPNVLIQPAKLGLRIHFFNYMKHLCPLV